MSALKNSLLAAALLSGAIWCTSHRLLAQGSATMRQTSYQERDRDDDRRNDQNRGYGNNQGYQRGIRDGQRDAQEDAQRGRGSDPTKNQNYRDAPGWNQGYGDRGQYQSTYRQAYANAYQQGIGNNQNGNNQNGNNQNGYGQNGYGQNGVDRGQNSANRRAYQNGLQAGQSDAQRDIRNNRTNVDFTQSDKYGKAAGWTATMGDRNQYKQAFREGYTAGYQQSWANVRRR